MLARLATASVLLLAGVTTVVLTDFVLERRGLLALLGEGVVGADAFRAVPQVKEHVEELIVPVLMAKLSPVKSFLDKLGMDVVCVQV